MTISAEWAAVVIATIVMLGSLAIALIRSARHEGKLEAILAQLVTLTTDHEARLRVLERSVKNSPLRARN